MSFAKGGLLLILGVILGMLLIGRPGEQPKSATPVLPVSDAILPLKRALDLKNAETDKLRRANAQLTQENVLIQRETDELRSRTQVQDRTLARQKVVVGKYTQVLSGTISRAIVRNGAGGIIGFIPIVGDAADAAATAVDIAEHCRLSKHLDELNREFNSIAINAAAKNEACRVPKKWKVPRLPWSIFR